MSTNQQENPQGPENVNRILEPVAGENFKLRIENAVLKRAEAMVGGRQPRKTSKNNAQFEENSGHKIFLRKRYFHRKSMYGQCFEEERMNKHRQRYFAQETC